MTSFTERNNIPIEPIEISIRFEAPIELRKWLLDLVQRIGFSIKSFRSIVCQMSFQAANQYQYSENEFMVSEVWDLLEKCQWNYIYDIIEQTYNDLPSSKREDFRLAINGFFLSNGYGWKLDNGQVLSCGDNAFEQSVQAAVANIESSNPDACNEIKEAITDISKRPNPDITGAIQHSLAALECFCRNHFHDEKPTLGELIKKHRNEIPIPLDKAMDSLWGFACEMGRHIREGRTPSFKDAEITVHICASLITYFKECKQ